MNEFNECLLQSHRVEDLPFWEEVYRKAFPTMIAMHNHRQDGDHQRQGIDRSIILENSKQILVDEKVRFRNKITGRIYEDVALEYLSNKEKNVAGWVCKPLLADFIAYAIAPLGKCFLLPVAQLQSAWQQNSNSWMSRFHSIDAKNYCNGKFLYTTVSCCVSVSELFKAIGQQLRISFNPFDGVE